MLKIYFDGRLTRDAELRVTENGNMVLNFTVAVDTGYGDNKVTEYIECSLWGERGEKIGEYLTKGLQVFVSGSASLRSWNRGSKSGVNFCCAVDNVTLGSLPKGRSEGEPAADGRDAFPPEEDKPF